MRPELLDELRGLIARRQKINAIKRCREETGCGLKQAKDAVDAIEQGQVPALPEPAPTLAPGLSPAALQELRQLAEQGETVEAIRMLRAATGWGLKEAHDVVEALRRGRPVPQLEGALAASLPARCPGCGALLGPSTVRWLSAAAGECLYCGGVIKTGG